MHQKSLKPKRATLALAALLPLMAHTGPAAHAQALTDLDLGSSKSNVVAGLAGTIGIGGTIDSNGQVVGANPMTVTKGQLITPAASVALAQTSIGSQRLLLGNDGVATGGAAVVSSTSSNVVNIANTLSSLVVPQGVTLSAVGFTTSSSLNVAGLANVLGSLHLLHADQSRTSLLSTGSDLSIGTNAIVSGLLPTSQSVTGLFNSEDLLITVAGTLTNDGRIQALYNLSISASQIANTKNGELIAPRNINLFSPNISNQGLVASSVGNININNAKEFNSTLASILNTSLSGLIGNSMEISGDGIFQANYSFNNAGQINIGGGVSNLQVNLSSSDYLARILNIDTGGGKLNAYVDESTGTVNIVAKGVSFGVDSPSLQLGNPSNYLNQGGTYFNTQGNIGLPLYSYSSGEDIAFLAKGDITLGTYSGYGGNGIYTSGGKITLISGAKITVDSLPNSSMPLVTVDGTSGSGGKIAIYGCLCTNGSLNGGDILIAANGIGSKTSQEFPGQITIPLVTLTMGQTNGKDGNVTLISGALETPSRFAAINMPSQSNGGLINAGKTGKVSINAAVPTGPATFTNGTVVSGGITAGTLLPVNLGTASYRMPLDIIAREVTINTAGDVYTAAPYAAPAGFVGVPSIGDSKFGSNFDMIGFLPIFLSGNIVGLNSNSTAKLQSAKVSWVYSYTYWAPYPTHGILNTAGSTATISANQVNLITDGDIVTNLGGTPTASLSAKGNVIVNSDGSLNLQSSSAGGRFEAQSANGLTVLGDISAGGAIRLAAGTAGQGNLLVGANSTISAGSNLAILNQDQSAGTISIGSGSKLSANGEISIAVGNAFNPVIGPTPQLITSSQANGGQIFFGPGIVATSGAQSAVSANSCNVVFANTGLLASPISIEGGVSINSKAYSTGSEGATSAQLTITSLDLTDPTVVSQMVQLQQQFPNLVGGTLVVQGGKATGGNLILPHLSNMSDLSAMNVPEGVKVTLTNFSPNNPIIVNLGSKSTTSAAEFRGDTEFASLTGASNPSITVKSTLSQPVMNIAGDLTSDGSLSLNAGGTITVSGALAASNGILSVTTSSGSNGAVLLSGTLQTPSTLSVTTDGTGAILQSAGKLDAGNVILSSTTGNFDLLSTNTPGKFSAITGGNIVAAEVHGQNIELVSGKGTLTLTGVLDSSGMNPNGAGGTVIVHGEKGIVFDATIPAILANANSNGKGGDIAISGASIAISGNNPLLLSANGKGTGSGGTLTVSTSTGDLSLKNSKGGIILSATGGSAGAASANGGTISIYAANNLFVDSSAVDASVLADNGNGASITLKAGSAGQGSLSIKEALSSNGVGTGNGGNILISADTTADITVNAPLSANSGSVGDGGTISIFNSGPGGIAITDVKAVGAGGKGSGEGPGDGYAGGDGGDVILQASGNISTGSVEAYGSGGGGSVEGNGGDGGNGGVIKVHSMAGSILVDGMLNNSGGGGGAGLLAGGNGGSANNLTVFANKNLEISGLVLSANGGKGSSSGTGGSFGGTGGTNSGDFGSSGSNQSGNGAAHSGGSNAGTGSSAGGQVLIVGQNVALTGKSAAGEGIFSGETVNASGAGGSIIITNQAQAIGSTVYSENADYSSTVRSETAPVLSESNVFEVGSVPVISGSAGSILAGLVSINSKLAAAPVTEGTFSDSAVTLLESGGPYTVVPGADVTPAELVAVIGVASGRSETLQLSGSTSNGGAAIGGNFLIAPENVNTFSNLHLPAGVTANVSTLVQVLEYTGNARVDGIFNLQANGFQLNVGGSTTVDGKIHFDNFGVLLAGGSITGNGIVESNNVSITSLNGDIGTLSKALEVNGGGSGLSLYASGSFVNVSNSTGEQFTFANALSPLKANSKFSLTTNGNIDSAASGKDAIESPSISLVSKNGVIAADTSALNPLFVSNSGAGVELYVDAKKVHIGTQNSDVVTLSNTNGALLASEMFQFSGNASVIAKVPANVVVISPSVSFSTGSGNIGADIDAKTPLLLSNSGQGLALFASGSKVNVSDPSAEDVTLSNGAGALSGSTSFSLNSKGSILTAVSSKQAIVSANVTLLSSTGNIGGNQSASSPLMISNGGNGLLLFASGKDVNLSDIAIETVTLNNNVTALKGVKTFTLSTTGDITSASAGKTGIFGETVSLISSAGNIGANNSASLPLLVSNGGDLYNGGIYLYLSANTVNVGDNTSETVYLDNRSQPLRGRTSFSVSNNNRLTTLDFNLTGIATPSLSLTTSYGYIGGGWYGDYPMLIENGGNGIKVFASGSAVRFQDKLAEPVIIANAKAPSQASPASSLNTMFLIDAEGDIFSEIPGNKAIVSSKVRLFSGGNIGGNAQGSIPLLVDNNGKGLSIFADGKIVNLSDTALEPFYIGTDYGPIYGSTSVTLTARGSFQSDGKVVSPNITLISTEGDIGTFNSPFYVENNGQGLTLYASGNKVNIRDTRWEDITLNNANSPLPASSFFNLTNIGHIQAVVPEKNALSSPSITLVTSAGNIAGNSTATMPLLVSNPNKTGLTLTVNSTKYVNTYQNYTKGGNVYVSDPVNELVTFARGSDFAKSNNSATDSLTVFSGRGFKTSASVTAPSVALNSTGGSTVITSAYPVDFDLSKTVPSLTIPALPEYTLIVGTGTQVAGNSITINGQTQATTTLGPGSYGLTTEGNYSITISGGPTGSKTITPSTLVTPAEWVAAVQVQDLFNQSLLIGTNSAATGGSFAIDTKNVPSNSFSKVVIPSAVTAQVNITTLQTNQLHNYGIVNYPAGGLTVSSIGTQTGNLQVGGTGQFASSSGSVTFQSNTGANRLFIDSGSNLTFSGALSLLSPSIVVGNSGASTAIINSGGTVSISSSPTGANALTLATDGKSATLQVNGGATEISNNKGISLGAGFVLSNQNSINISNKGTGNITAATGSIIVSPNLTVSNAGGDIGQESAPLQLKSDLTNPATVNLALRASGSAYINDAMDNDSIRLSGEQTDALSLSAKGAVYVDGKVAASKSITLATTILNVSPGGTISGATINITGAQGGDLLLANCGLIEATSGDITATSAAGTNLILGVYGQSGILSASNGNVYLTAGTKSETASKVEFVGNQAFAGDAIVTSPGSKQSVVVNSNVEVFIPLNSTIFINTNNFINEGKVGPGKIVLNATSGIGTIQNPSGSIDLANLGNLVFSGQTLTILASGNITNSGAAKTIDLSSAITGGSLTLISGYNFSPSNKASNSPVTGEFILGSPTGTPSKINLPNVSINTRSTAPFGVSGKVTAVATGSISLGNINTNNTGIGGAVLLIGTGVSAKSIDTSGVDSGSISISSALPTANGQVSISDGILVGTFSAGTPGGNISIGNLNAGKGNVLLTTGGAGTITQAAGTTVSTSGVLTVSNGTKGFTLKTAAANLQLSSSGNATITSTVPTTLRSSTVAGNLKVSSNSGLFVGKGQSVVSGGSIILSNSNLNTDLQLLDGMNLLASKEVSLNSPGRIFVGAGTINTNSFFSAKSSAGYLQVSGASINSASTSTLYALSGITIEKSANLNSKGNLTVTAADGYANLTIADNVSLNVGALKGTPAANGILSPTEISSKAGMTLTAGSAVGIGSNNIWTANGGDIKLTAKGTAGAAIGFIGMGTNNKFVANGGNIIILAKGVVYGNDGNFFHARAAGTSVSNGKGGGIEVGSGLSTSTFLTSAFVLPKNTNPAVGALGPNVTYTGNIGGVIKANISGGGNVNLNWFGTNPSELNLNGNPATGGGGVQVFDAKGAGSQILFDNASFQTEAFKPIAMVSNVRLENSQSERISTNRQADFTDVKIGKHNSDYKVFAKKDGTNFVTAGSDDVLPAKCELVAQVFAQRRSILRHEAGRITLGTGEMLLNAHQTMQITTTLATVKVENGALAFVSSTENGTCIRVLSSAGTVSAFVDGQKISVSSGEELLVTRNKPSTSTSHFKDGVGRRNTNTSDCGSKYITTSDFSILSMLSNSDCFDARSERNKQLIARILKTAATVDVVFRTRGPYTAR